MMISESRESLLLERSWESPCIPLVSVPIDALVAGCRQRHFPELRRAVRVYFVDRGTLACILIPNDLQEPATIYIHQLLNRAETPELVLRLIVLHELLHLVVPGREIGGRETMHPPEFWAREVDLIPDRGLAWAWIHWNFGALIRSDKRRECTHVRARWKKMVRLECVPLDRIIAIGQSVGGVPARPEFGA